MASTVVQYQTVSQEIMPPSPLGPNASRHGRGRHGGSITKNKTRGRGYSVIDDREWLISKALSKILKHNINEDKEPETSEDKSVDNSNGWVDCEDILARPDMTALDATFSDLEVLCSIIKPKFVLKTKLNNVPLEDKTASDYIIRFNPSTNITATVNVATPQLTPLSIETPDLPKLVVYETSYSNYPLILASGAIRRAGGQAHLSFKPISLFDTTELPPVTADVSIYIDLRSAINLDANVQWLRSDKGAILTEGDSEGKIDKSFWKSVVARRMDIGVLFEDGQVKKEVPIGLRGKGVKPKKGGKGKGKGNKEIRVQGEDQETIIE